MPLDDWKTGCRSGQSYCYTNTASEIDTASMSELARD